MFMVIIHEVVLTGTVTSTEEISWSRRRRLHWPNADERAAEGATDEPHVDPSQNHRVADPFPRVAANVTLPVIDPDVTEDVRAANCNPNHPCYEHNHVNGNADIVA